MTGEDAMERGQPDAAPEGVADAVQQLRGLGYGDSIEVSAAGIWCSGCGQQHPLGGIVQERIYRFEGASNPDDMSIVVGLRCRVCGRTGIIVSAFGPGADPHLFDLLKQMRTDASAHDPTT